MLLHRLLLAFSYLAATVTAADPTCWRDTPCSGPANASFPDGPWTANFFTPPQRVVWPRQVLNGVGNVTGIYYPLNTVLAGNSSRVVFDFGVEIGGTLVLDYNVRGTATIGMAFSETKTYIGEWSDSSTGSQNKRDGQLFDESPNGTYWNHYASPDGQLRGGFRFLTVWLQNATNETSARIYNVQVEMSIQPAWSNLRAYSGYFHSSDEQLNRIWYMGAYTLQMNSIPPKTGRPIVHAKHGWWSDATVGYGTSILVDGAKRGRRAGPAYLGIAIPSAFFSTGDLLSSRNTLQTLYYYQQYNGSFSRHGPPSPKFESDTYHMWTLIATHDYVFYADDQQFLLYNWGKFVKGVDYILRKVNRDGLLTVTGTRDWARNLTVGESSEANMMLYRTLVTASKVALWAGSDSVAERWASRASALKHRIQTSLYNFDAKAFFDSPQNTALYPQDSNAMALYFNVATETQKGDVSHSLLKNWGPFGPDAPELPGNVSPFVTSMELDGHFQIGQTYRALDLLRRTWGFQLKYLNGTQSSMMEGFRSDGTLGYRAEYGYNNDTSFVSQSHSWSTGPTSALTKYIAGLDIRTRAGMEWSFSPQFANLQFAEAGFTTRLGKFRSRWVINRGQYDAPNGYNVTIEAPEITRGSVYLPGLKRTSMIVKVNNDTMDVATYSGGAFFELQGGSYNITVRPVVEKPFLT